jgi:hypothetical protein
MGSVPGDAFFDNPLEFQPPTKHPQPAKKGRHIPLPDDTVTHHALRDDLAGADATADSGCAPQRYSMPPDPGVGRTALRSAFTVHLRFMTRFYVVVGEWWGRAEEEAEMFGRPSARGLLSLDPSKEYGTASSTLMLHVPASLFAAGIMMSVATGAATAPLCHRRHPGWH